MTAKAHAVTLTSGTGLGALTTAAASTVGAPALPTWVVSVLVAAISFVAVDQLVTQSPTGGAHDTSV